jgi:GMP synthase-like glutamine amidotransferase
MKVLAVVQHTSAEYLGNIEDHLEGRRIRFRYSRPFTSGGRVPKPGSLLDGLVLLGGGPWGSAGARNVPTLDEEVELTRIALDKGLPVLGIGLGAQILALAAGGGSTPSELVFEVGEATRTRPDALAGFLPERYPLVTYGRDRPVLPPGADVFAHDAAGRPVLFQVGERALGFTGHPGTKPAIVEDLIMEFEEAPATPGPSLEQLRGVRVALEDALVSIMTGVVRILGLMDQE